MKSLMLAALFLSPNAAEKVITSENLPAHIKVLSSEEFEGRAPSTRGEELTVKYLTDQFKRYGLQPGNPAGFGRQKEEQYNQNDYHQVSDEIKAGWDLSGEVQDVRLLFEVGRLVANSPTFPEWKPSGEFKARRESMLK